MIIKKIMVVGCGGIGSRHLQALGKIDIPVKLWAIEPNEHSLDNAKKLFYEIPVNDNVKSVKFCKELPKDINIIDLCIIATSSNVRLNVLRQLVSNFSIKNIILEKVLFQSEDQLDEAKKIINENKIRCWVNCFRREEEFWKKIKNYLIGNTNLKLYYGKPGGNLCTNSIHIIDLAAWLFNDKIKHIDNSDLDSTIYESKREGFVELTGVLKVQFEKGGTLQYESKNGVPIENAEFEITSDTVRLKIHEFPEGKGTLCRKENYWKPEKHDFYIPFQSEKTQKIAKKILENSQCDLTPLDESIEIHRPLLRCFINHLNKISNSKYNYCPIT